MVPSWAFGVMQLPNPRIPPISSPLQRHKPSKHVATRYGISIDATNKSDQTIFIHVLEGSEFRKHAQVEKYPVMHKLQHGALRIQFNFEPHLTVRVFGPELILYREFKLARDPAIWFPYMASDKTDFSIVNIDT